MSLLNSSLVLRPSGVLGLDRRAFNRRVVGILLAPTLGCRGSGPDEQPADSNAGESPHRSIYMLDAADRQDRLVAGAQREGTVVVYTSLNTQDSTPLATTFEKKYGVRTELWRSASERVVQRGATESRAGRFTCDVFETNGPEMEALYRERLLDEFQSPHFADLPPAAFPQHRHWIADRFNYNHNAERVAVQGAPIRWKALTPTFGRPNAIGVARRAPHPYAALLFADFVLSREGQVILKERNRVPASRAVDSHLNDFPFETIDPAITLDEDAKWAKLWSDLFLRGQQVPRDAG